MTEVLRCTAMTDKTERVLAHLARRFAVSPENIASESLTWILRRSAAASGAVSVLVRTFGAEVPDGLTFVGQVGSPDTGRPDVVGTDDQSRARVLIEAKFAAGLTAQQPGGYLNSLTSGEPSCLLVVAPSVRLASLWVELLRAVPELVSEVPAPSSLGETRQHLDAGAGRALAMVSWRELVLAVLDAVRASGELSLVQDTEQLLALTEAMDEAEFEPARPEDFSFRTARQLHQLESVIQSTYYRVIKGPTVEKIRGRPSHGRTFYGWYVRAAQAQKSIWFGYLPRAWSKHGISPLWARLSETKAWSRQRLETVLAPFGRTGGSGLFDDDRAFLIPLSVPLHAGKADVIDSVIGQLKAIAARLDAAVGPGEVVVPDEPEADGEGDDVDLEPGDADVIGG